MEAQSWAQSGPAPNITGHTGSSSEAHPQPCQTPGMGGGGGGGGVEGKDCLISKIAYCVEVHI